MRIKRRKFTHWPLIVVVSVLIAAGVAEPVAAGDNYFSQIYMHDPARLESFEDAATALKTAREANKDLWDTMLANQISGLAASRRQIQETGRLRLEGLLVSIDQVPWANVWACGVGECVVTSDGLEDLIDLTKADLAAIDALTPANSTTNQLKERLEIIKKLSMEIDGLTKRIKQDPDASKQLAQLPSGPIETPVKDAITKLDKVIADIDTKVTDIGTNFNNAMNKVDIIIGKAEEWIQKAAFLDGLADSVTGVKDALDIIRRKDALETVKGGVLKGIEEKSRESALPSSISKAFKDAELKGDNGNDITTVGQLLDFLTSEKSEVEEIRLVLLSDMRKTISTRRGLRLTALKAELTQHQRMARTLKAQRAIEKELNGLRTVVTGFQTYNDTKVVAEAKEEAHRVVNTMEAIHRKYQNEKNELNKQELRDAFETITLLLMQYVARVGYLQDAANLMELEIAALKHRFSIEESRIAALEWEILASRGMEGLVAFNKGGIKPEDYAGIIAFIQTGLLSTIAVTN